MRYVLQAVLSNAQHPEYGQATIPFPIPNQNYDSTIELLGPLEIGDTLRQDCQVDELDSFYTVLNTLIGTQVTLDELDYACPFTDRNDCCMSHHSNSARVWLSEKRSLFLWY